MPRRPKTQDPDYHLARMEDDARMLDIRMRVAIRQRAADFVPGAWQEAHERSDCRPAKKRMTIRLDAEVLDWYRALGHGYQLRINEVLRCYMDAVVSKYVEPQHVLDRIGPDG